MITRQQPGPKVLARPRSFRRNLRFHFDDLKVDSMGEVFVEQMVGHKYSVRHHGIAKEDVPVPSATI